MGLLAGAQVVQSAEPASNLACSKDAGPQSPRDIAVLLPGTNTTPVKSAEPPAKMNLCNIHFHRNAEHKVTSSKTIAVKGANIGFVCEKADPAATKKPAQAAGATSTAGKGGESAHVKCDSVAVNDTIEVHWVFTSCPSPDKPTMEKLGNCTQCKDYVLRVEAKVFLLTDDNDKDGVDFANFEKADGKFQPKMLPDGKGAVEYNGSTTGPSYNSVASCSPVKATWSVRPECSPLKLSSLKSWCSTNKFGEKEAHGVRPLVTKAELLSVAQKK